MLPLSSLCAGTRVSSLAPCGHCRPGMPSAGAVDTDCPCAERRGLEHRAVAAGLGERMQRDFRVCYVGFFELSYENDKAICEFTNL